LETQEKTRMKLTSEAVDDLMSECLFADDEPMENAVEVEGIVNRYAFHPTRVAEHADEIGALLAELPDEFQAGRGGGWSFLNACDDRTGRQWTGLHQQMERLFALGIATGKARWLMPREVWNVLPGNVPYVSVDPSYSPPSEAR
jgi:hypothetical protein